MSAAEVREGETDGLEVELAGEVRHRDPEESSWRRTPRAAMTARSGSSCGPPPRPSAG